MAVTELQDAFIVYGPYDVSGDHNETRLDHKADIKEKTTFGQNTHVFVPGLEIMEVAGRGLVQFDDGATPKAVDFNLFNEIKAVEKGLTLAPTRTDNEIAYLFRAVADTYAFALSVDNVGTFDFNIKSAGNKCARGRILLPLSSRVAAGNGSINNSLGAITAAQKLIASLHVTAFVGTTMTMSIKSNTSGVTAGATTRLTFNAATGVTSEYKEVSGPVTDTFWYADWTFTGTSFSAAVSAGIR